MPSNIPLGGGQVSLDAVRRWDQIEVSVLDSRVAIPAEDIPHLFERFYRVENSRSRETGGAGLGLAISQEIVRRHDGEIEAQSQPGNTIFSVRLPVRNP